MRQLADFLRDPLLQEVDVDDAARFRVHRLMLQRKRMLRAVFCEFHYLFRSLSERFLSGSGVEIEIGAGVAPMRDSYPEVLSTDIVAGPHLDRVLNAEAMDLPDGSLKVLYGQNCFHHLPRPRLFFRELERVLAPGGGAILLEPYYGPLARLIYKHLFRTEGFDPTYPSWEVSMSGPMRGANQALSYIVFVRDRAEFEREYPSLTIVHQQTVGNYLKYLLSGGLNFRQLIPDRMTGFITIAEKLLQPFARCFALHHIVVLRKLSR